MVVPSGFTEFFENLSICASFIIGDGDGDKMRFDEFYERLVREDFGPEDAAAVSSWNFLEEEKDWFPGCVRFFERFGEGGLIGDGANFYGLICTGVAGE